MIDSSFSNLVIYSAQILVLVGTAAAAASLLKPRTARLRFAYWRGVVLACLALPPLALLRPTTSFPVFSTSIVSEIITTSSTVSVGEPANGEWWFLPAIWLLASGAFVTGIWLLAGLAQLRRLRRESLPITLDDEIDL